MILVALKAVGGKVWTRFTNDPLKRFKDEYGGETILMPVEGKQSGIYAVAHKQPDFDAGVNLELFGNILHGPVMLVNVCDGHFASLTPSQMASLERAGLCLSAQPA